MSSSYYVAPAALFVLGVLLLFAANRIARARRARLTPPAAWTRLVDSDLVVWDDAQRLEMIERLALLNTPWSRSVLEAALEQEHAVPLRAAIEHALRI